MIEQLVAASAIKGIPRLAPEEGDEGFCPECGQSLDLAWPQEAPVKRGFLEPFIFLFFGLCLAVTLGIRAWNTHGEIFSLDQQVADMRARATQDATLPLGKPSLVVADTMGEVLADQRARQIDSERNITGLGFGLFAIFVGMVSWLRERPGPMDGQRRVAGSRGFPSPVRPQVGTGPWALGVFVAITIVRMGLMMFVAIIGLQLLRGVPPSLQFIDQALTGIAALVFTIVTMVS